MYCEIITKILLTDKWKIKWNKFNKNKIKVNLIKEADDLVTP